MGIMKRIDDYYAKYDPERERRANLYHQWFGIAVTVGACGFLVYLSLAGLFGWM